MPIEHLLPVPHLTTAQSGPLHTLEAHLLENQTQIETWFRQQWQKIPAPFYTSVDLRNAGFKLAPVDTNLFPAGFNNLNPAFQHLCIQAMQSAIERICPDAANILLLPENHTRNLHYFESLATLRDIINKAGYSVRIGSLNPELEKNTLFSLPSGRSVELHPLFREANRLKITGFDPCVILLNNDLSDGIPEILKGLEQTVLPPPDLGWAMRLKSGHFAHYRRVAKEFATIIDIDPWLIDPLFRNCGEINFLKREGEECVRKNTEIVFEQIRQKYAQYGINQAPFVIVKADAGTYGMGIMSIYNINELQELNRKERTRMSASKGGQPISKVIIQEGIYSHETWEGAVAEPVVYMIDHFVVGGFYRVHRDRGPTENLNAPGMYFEPLAFAEPCNTPDCNKAPDANPNRFYAYGVIARLAMLAAAREYAEHR
ncbi:MAG: glutamate--cysteine ligase [Gammaproteobacteria bacterium]|nr:glutamate--cysteine ligase [Gammaproteobacteria bacterium]